MYRQGGSLEYARRNLPCSYSDRRHLNLSLTIKPTIYLIIYWTSESFAAPLKTGIEDT